MATSSASDNTGVPFASNFSRGLSSGDQLLIFRGVIEGSFIQGSFLQFNLRKRVRAETNVKRKTLPENTQRGFTAYMLLLFFQSVHEFGQLGFLVGRFLPMDDIILRQFVNHGRNLFQQFGRL